MLDHKIELLQRVPLFVGLSEDQLNAIASAGQKRFFEADENLIAEGETGNAAFLILTGKAGCPKIEKGDVLVEDLWPGTLVGELGMLVETVHSLTVKAKERLRALAFHRDAFRALMEKDPSLAQHISERLLVRLHGLAAELRKVDSKLSALEKAA
jgi:CRP/FNR family transcriptional regulator, cyclic AMP receptor protein